MVDWNAFVNSIIYAALGIALFAGGFWVLDKLTPYDLWRQIVEEKNLALAGVLQNPIDAARRRCASFCTGFVIAAP